MSDIIIYHGGTEVIEKPLCRIGRKELDFGQGFYVTDLRQQAVSWANTVSLKRQQPPLLNIYRLQRDEVLRRFRCKIFTAYDAEWLDFIVANRNGDNVAQQFDFVEGGVANDRVIDTVNLYISGLMDFSTALSRLAEHRPNNQICILNQEIIDNYLTYDRTESI